MVYTAAWSPPTQRRIFVCYASEDEDLYDQFHDHLQFYANQREFLIWHEGMLQETPGVVIAEEINKHLKSAALTLLLVSKKFVNSEHCQDIMERALERYKNGETIVVSILVHDFSMVNAPFTNVRMLPVNKRPLTKWSDPDEGASNICASINEIILSILIEMEVEERVEDKISDHALANAWYLPAGNHDEMVGNEFSVYNNNRFNGGCLDEETRRYYEEEVRHCNARIRQNPNDADAYSKKGRALCQLRHFLEAVEILEKAIRLNPKNHIDHWNLGWALYELRRFEQAIAVLEIAIQLCPRNPIAHLIKIWALHDLNRFKEALCDVEKALDIYKDWGIRPNMDELYLVKGKALHSLGKFKKARAAFAEAISLYPRNAFYYRDEYEKLREDEALRKPLITRRVIITGGLAAVIATTGGAGGLLLELSRSWKPAKPLPPSPIPMPTTTPINGPKSSKPKKPLK